ncbi:plant intracellular Ras-group-related LRR protein 6 [Cucumis melo var. makuwa]|uniref:Plant intracellular Ras-group-related LRR protein 6 n=1 Tax=Cucumis melo var. makuwa TaxID=1194695 RepID=A0A5A7V2E1_CUCMM|nr:plant intracellular Ras-group-related LRR protein 6 [Cucumis melo var. makuwa]
MEWPSEKPSPFGSSPFPCAFHFLSFIPVTLHLFGCAAYVYNFGPNQTKFTPRAQTYVFVGYPLHQRGYKCFHPPFRKYFVTIDVTFCEDRPYLSVSHLQGESMSEESNCTFEFIEPIPSTVSDIDPHPIIQPTNQVPWKTYYRRNLRKEVGSPTSQPPTPVQDSEPPRDQGMENPIEPCTNNTMSENDRSDVAILKNVEKNDSGDKTEVRTEISNNQTEQGRTGNIDKYNPSIDLLICALPKGGKPVGCKWLFTLKYKADGILDRHKASHLEHSLTDSLPLSSSKVEISQLKQRMGNEFEIKDLGNLKYFLGMEILILSRNKIKDWPGAILKTLPNLTCLKLDNNPLKQISSDGFQAVSMLQVLDLSGNIACLPEHPTFSSLPLLQELYLRRMRLHEVPSSILGLKHMRILDLSQNSIQLVPEGLKNLAALAELDLSDNNISMLPPQLVRMDLDRIL